MSPRDCADQCGFYSIKGTASVSAFSEFTDLCARFLWACQYDGHLAHNLNEFVAMAKYSDKHKADKKTRTLALRLLIELRRKLWAPENDHVTVEDLMVGSAQEAVRLKEAGKLGRPLNPADCPWCSGPNSGPDLSSLQADERKRFGDGESAREALVEMVDIAGIATRQTHEYVCILSLPWNEKQIQQRAEDALAHPHFETGCYSEATSKYLERWPRLLRERNPDVSRISLKTIRRLVTHPIKRPESPMTYFGRFGTIVRDCLKAMNKESAGKSYAGQETETPVKRSSAIANRIESLLEEYAVPDRRLLSRYVALRKNAIKRGPAVKQVAEDAGVTQSYVRGLVKELHDRV